MLRVDENELNRQRQDCEKKVLSAHDEGTHCPAVWDELSCWNATPAGTTAVMDCPSYVAEFDPARQAYRECTADGSWWMSPENRTWTNYTQCINTDTLVRDTQLIYVWIAGYVTSMTASIAAVIIFIYFRRQLACDRVTLHNHLFLSYILNGLCWILYYTLAALDVSVLERNPVWCRALHAVTQYFLSCNFFWMFSEGLYLHTIIVHAFTTGRRLVYSCIAIGWGVPVVTATVYTVARAHHPHHSAACWVIDNYHLQWIVAGPIIATLAVNLIFLCNIVRVLVTKLRAVNSPDTVQTKKAVRATLILIPLLGLQYVLFPMRPQHDGRLKHIHNLTVAVVTSLQGLFVAVIFCFTNGEAVRAVRRQCQQCFSMDTCQPQTYDTAAQLTEHQHHLSHHHEPQQQLQQEEEAFVIPVDVNHHSHSSRL